MTNKTPQPLSEEEIRMAIDDYGARVAIITKKYIASEYSETERDKRWKEAAETLEKTILQERQAYAEYVIGKNELVVPIKGSMFNDDTNARNGLRAEQRKRNTQKEQEL